MEVGGLDLAEVGRDALETLWVRGGLPASFLAQTDSASFALRDGYVRDFIERDVELLRKPWTEQVQRFWTMTAHRHGQSWNSSQVAASLCVDQCSARDYLDLLADMYMLRVVPAWVEKIRKRQRKAPRVYVRDSGLLRALLGLKTREAVLSHPVTAASGEVLRSSRA
jgi:hypothetical protein